MFSQTSYTKKLLSPNFASKMFHTHTYIYPEPKCGRQKSVSQNFTWALWITVLVVFLFSFLFVLFLYFTTFYDEYTLHLFALIFKNIINLHKTVGNNLINGLITLGMLSRMHQVKDLAMGFKRSILESKIFYFKPSCPSTFCSFPSHHKNLILLSDLFFPFILLGKFCVEEEAYITICKIDSQW